MKGLTLLDAVRRICNASGVCGPEQMSISQRSSFKSEAREGAPLLRYFLFPENDYQVWKARRQTGLPKNRRTMTGRDADQILFKKPFNQFVFRP